MNPYALGCPFRAPASSPCPSPSIPIAPSLSSASLFQSLSREMMSKTAETITYEILSPTQGGPGLGPFRGHDGYGLHCPHRMRSRPVQGRGNSSKTREDQGPKFSAFQSGQRKQNPEANHEAIDIKKFETDISRQAIACSIGGW